MNRNNIFFIFALVSLSTCNRARIQNHYERIENFIGKEIILPDSIHLVDIINKVDGNFYLYDTISSIKVTTSIEGDCHVCVSQLKSWESFINSNKDYFDNVSFIFFVRAYDYSVFEYLVDELFFSYPVVYDKSEKYLLYNKLYNSNYQTFLLNEKNEICLVGNPVKNTELAKLYIQEITKMKDNHIFQNR